MEEKAKALMEKIQVLCVKYHYEKEDIVLKEARNMLTEIQDFCYAILHSDFSEINAEDGQVLRGYTVQYIGGLYRRFGMSGYRLDAGYFRCRFAGIIRNFYKYGNNSGVSIWG